HRGSTWALARRGGGGGARRAGAPGSGCGGVGPATPAPVAGGPPGNGCSGRVGEGTDPPRASHPVGGGDAEEVERLRDRPARQVYQREPALPHRALGGEHGARLVEVGE